MNTSQTPKRHPDAGTLGHWGCFVRGRFVRTGSTVDVRSPFSGSVCATVHRAGPGEIEQAIAGAAAAFAETRRLPGYRKEHVLLNISKALESSAEDFARTIALEAGKPVKTARAELERAVFTFKVAAEESKRIGGEIIPLDWVPAGEAHTGYLRCVALGPVLGITPFNFPLNLVAHKVAPAIAAGDPIIIRPSSQTPVTALKLGEIVAESGWPQEAIAVLPCSTDDASLLVGDERLKMLSFTGSPDVGWKLKPAVGRKRVSLELGGNAAAIVHSDADLEKAAELAVKGGYSHAGQSCISVQRIYVHRDVYDRFESLITGKVRMLRTGDPLDEETDVGPVIDQAAADRIGSWVDEALDAGARLLTGGGREGLMFEPMILADVSEDMTVSCREAFAPLVILYRYSHIEDALRRADDSEFGLQAAVFTFDTRIIRRAFDSIEVGGLMVNEITAFRVDHMPYGGVKQSGLGREGLRYAIREMSEMKLMVVNESLATGEGDGPT